MKGIIATLPVNVTSFKKIIKINPLSKINNNSNNNENNNNNNNNISEADNKKQFSKEEKEIEIENKSISKSRSRSNSKEINLSKNINIENIIKKITQTDLNKNNDNKNKIYNKYKDFKDEDIEKGQEKDKFNKNLIEEKDEDGSNIINKNLKEKGKLIKRQSATKNSKRNISINEDVDINILSQDKERARQLNTNFSETIMLFKDKPHELNMKNMKTDEFNNFVNNSDKFFNIGQGDNFSIFNSYETMMNYNQKYDFFADSNVSFKNSFLRNMKNKTDFKNMNLIKNSFSQSTINIPEIDIDNKNDNDNDNENSKSVKNISKQTKKSNFISNTIYSKKVNTKNQNNLIFNIDEETYNEDVQKYKTLNQMILKHLNKNEFINIISNKKIIQEKITEKFKNNLEVSINSSKLLSKPPTLIKFDNNNSNNNNNLHENYNKNKFSLSPNLNNNQNIIITEPKYTEKINEDYYKREKLTEKDNGDFRYFTDINEDEYEKNNKTPKYVEYGINTNESIFTNRNNYIKNEKDSEKFVGIASKNTKFFINNNKDKANFENNIEINAQNIYDINEINNNKNKSKSKQKINNGYDMKRSLWEKLNKRKNIDDSANSLYDTKTIKINDKMGISLKKKNRITLINEDTINKTKNKTKSNSPIKEKDIFIGGGGLITSLKKNENENENENSNYKNFSILNKLEKKGFKFNTNDTNDFSYNNKNLIKSISDVYFTKKSILLFY
jgi:hypothetical protein